MNHRIEIPVPAWDENLSVGNALIDLQHKQLLSLGRSGVALLSGEPLNRDEFHHVLNDFVDLARMHFKTEEALLASNHCPDLEAHQQEHEGMNEALVCLLLDGIHNIVDQTKLAELLTTWLTHHLLFTDLPNRDYLRE